MKTGFLLLYTHAILTEVAHTASVKAPLDVISLDDITPQEREHLEYLNSLNDQREKRSSHGFLSAVGSGIKLLGQSSAASSSHSYYDDHPPEPEHHDGKTFDFWGLKKSVLNTLLQAAKAVKGAAIALTGKLIKGSGYLVSAKGKLISAKGEAVSELGKKIASSAVLSPPVHYHHTGYSDHHHEEYHSAYGPSGSHDVEVSPSAPAIHYSHPPHSPSKYTNFEDAKQHETLHGLPSGILILKKIPRHIDAQESVKIPDFQPLKSKEPEKTQSSPMFSSLLTNIFTSSSHVQPQTSETTHAELHSKLPPPKTIDVNEDFSSIKPVIEEQAISNSKPYTIHSLQEEYNAFPNELIDIPQTGFSDFSTHPGFYINNLATSNNDPNLNSLTSFPTQFSSDHLHPANFNPELQLLQDPRSLKHTLTNYRSTMSTSNEAKLKSPSAPPSLIKHNHEKRTPSKPNPLRIKSPTNYDLIKSLSFQLGPHGPIKI